ncbi:hypothetical protein IKD57_00610 [Candidatus Saccharibacteria bacterium]|nr:hypothetical protein [Candidatus Saccharibacteria bacterium]
MSEDWKIEESDDERTLSDSNEITEDCNVKKKEVENENFGLPVMEYLSALAKFVDTCGQLSYFWNMKNNMSAKVDKVLNIADEYNHTNDYYNKQHAEWKAKAEKAYIKLEFFASIIGYEMPEQKKYINLMALSKDRRECYRYYLERCLKNKETLPPDEFEKLFERRLSKRLNKKK